MARYNVYFMLPSFTFQGMQGIKPADLTGHSFVISVVVPPRTMSQILEGADSEDPDKGIIHDLEYVFDWMQASRWINEGVKDELKAHAYLKLKGIQRDCMGPGDIIEDELGHFWFCENKGWSQLSFESI